MTKCSFFNKSRVKTLSVNKTITRVLFLSARNYLSQSIDFDAWVRNQILHLSSQYGWRKRITFPLHFDVLLTCVCISCKDTFLIWNINTTSTNVGTFILWSWQMKCLWFFFILLNPLFPSPPSLRLCLHLFLNCPYLKYKWWGNKKKGTTDHVRLFLKGQDNETEYLFA